MQGGADTLWDLAHNPAVREKWAEKELISIAIRRIFRRLKSTTKERSDGRGGSVVIQNSADSLLAEIEAFCRHTGIAESTFGRQAVNDGKLCVRLRNGKDVTLDTAAKIRGYIEGQSQPSPPTLNGTGHLEQRKKKGTTTMSGDTKRKVAKKNPQTADGSADRPFRFYDNRQKYLAFVNTCNEKAAGRRAREPRELAPPAVHRRRRFACSMPAWATPPCSRASCAAIHRHFSDGAAAGGWRRKSVWKMCGSGSRRWRIGSSSIRIPCLVITNLELFGSAAADAARCATGRGAELAGGALTGRSTHEYEEQISKRWDLLLLPWLADQAKRANRQSDLRAALGAGDLPRRPPVPAAQRRADAWTNARETTT